MSILPQGYKYAVSFPKTGIIFAFIEMLACFIATRGRHEDRAGINPQLGRISFLATDYYRQNPKFLKNVFLGADG